MAGDRIEGRDIVGDMWCARRGVELFGCLDDSSCVASVHMFEGSKATTGYLDANASARLAIFLLEAASVGLVGAARNVVAARAKVEAMNAARLLVPEEEDDVDDDDEAFRGACDERDAAVREWDAIAAKLDAMVGHDMSEATREK